VQQEAPVQQEATAPRIRLALQAQQVPNLATYGTVKQAKFPQPQVWHRSHTHSGGSGGNEAWVLGGALLRCVVIGMTAPPHRYAHALQGKVLTVAGSGKQAFFNSNATETAGWFCRDGS